MFYKIICLILFLTLSSCSFSRPDIRQEFVSDIIHQVGIEAQKEYGLEIYGCGSSIPDKIKEISARFCLDRPIPFPEARKLYVLVAQKFLDKVNANEKMRPYLENYPFTEYNLDLFITFKTKNFAAFPKPDISLIMLSRGVIIYSKWDPEKQTYAAQDDFKEPYSEAFKIVFGDPSNKNGT